MNSDLKKLPLFQIGYPCVSFGMAEETLATFQKRKTGRSKTH